MGSFIAPHILVTTTRLGLHDASCADGRRVVTNEGQNRGAQMFRRGKKEAERPLSGSFGVEPCSRGVVHLTVAVWKMLFTITVTFVSSSMKEGRKEGSNEMSPTW
jgi:hypothetical protein